MENNGKSKANLNDGSLTLKKIPYKYGVSMQNSSSINQDLSDLKLTGGDYGLPLLKS
jgi:hypothetical protein